MDTKKYKKLVSYTKKEKKPELVLKNGNVILVQSGLIKKMDIAIQDGYIIGLGEYDGIKNIDCTGKYISPGFIDSHLHFESTLLNPGELVYYASLSGTTTFIADPHEAANVKGLDGINYIIEQTKNSQALVYIMMPSCVPCIDGEDNGCVLKAIDMKKILKNKRILGLAEVMDVYAVINSKKSMVDKLNLFKNKIKDGHAPCLDDITLQAYALSGIKTDHECMTYEYAEKQINLGMTVLIREGSACKNVAPIVKGIVKNNTNTSNFCFCTDDKHIEDIKEVGHIRYNIKLAIENGLDPIKAYQMASINSAKCYKLEEEIGSISIGKKANIVILSDYKNVIVENVLFEGKEIEKTFSGHIENKNKDLENTVNVSWFTKDMLRYKELSKEQELFAIEVFPKELFTKKRSIGFSNTKDMNEYLKSLNFKNINRAIVIERHHNKKKYALAPIYGFNLKDGAIASSVSHDSHNITIVGDNTNDMYIALKAIDRMQGGYVLVHKGKIYEEIPLQIMGLMSKLYSDEVSERLSKMIKKAHEMGVPNITDPFIWTSFISLAVLPEIRLTTNGLYDVQKNTFLNV